MILGIDFGMGVAGTVAVEFILAHAYLWLGKGGTTVAQVVTAADTQVKNTPGLVTKLVADVKAIPAEIKAIPGEIKAIPSEIKAEVGRAEQFFGSWFSSNSAPAAQTAPAVAQTAPVVAQTAPKTTGTPVPSIVLVPPPAS